MRGLTWAVIWALIGGGCGAAAQNETPEPELAVPLSHDEGGLAPDAGVASGMVPCSPDLPDPHGTCPSNAACDQLDWACFTCWCPLDCTYGRPSNGTCRVRPEIPCLGSPILNRTFTCQYCFQSPARDHVCEPHYDCHSVAAPPQRVVVNCSAPADLLCLGRRNFLKRVRCNWTGGYKWSTAMVLSITLGGFGADRFYLGHWQEGIGKLFSFGGLGVWTLVDVVMIAIRYVGPADGSLYI
ncbi:hypothetical protein TCAL_02075 [Tigriopus californicus]|uniref:TM2 domain-containing protein n=1 Tax=Tigriopus californicus TaxID=6832 RepID=A0A553NEY5_TIGCA|nr:TM2 domain-containing protein 3-like [Tigriopus californicus]TRY63991.1 hypothetical protein TCAL_02075 [Tigriopus californicus]|eukprot:TCALIF_02075-PA protein Name:"Similar to tm2d3 TM2 domain-containing protein 3 (Xenopus tropicalis)" AED:0.34 eAED:0.34 QI:0/0/0/1/0/0/2/0/239